MKNKPRQIGIEFVLPMETAGLYQHGIESLNQLFGQLSPYRQSLTAEDFKRLAAESACFLVAIDLGRNDGHIAGIARLVVTKKDSVRYGVIHDVVVDMTYRGQGIGRALVQKLLALARLFQLDYVQLTSKPARVEANQMYQTMGFSLITPADPSIEDSTNHYQFSLRKR